ncbi:MAG: type II secretion system F family protein [Micropruina sp.]|uniref:type II secretion system F family protein n=1 Tax=Micropruina sp. TaxID=2737536 RepID=UPI0039E5E3D1
MTGVLAAVAGAMIAGGILGIVVGLRPVPVTETKRSARRSAVWRRRWATISPARRWATGVALVAGVVVAWLTGWVIAIVVFPVAVLGLPVLLAAPTDTVRIEKLDGIAEWTRNLSGVLVAGQGLEQALIASLRSCPDMVRPEVAGLVARLRSRWPTDAALRAFADDLDDATGDLVAAALTLGARKRGPGLAGMLTGLAESAAADVKARRQIEADRAKPRTIARLVTVLSAGALTVLALTGSFLEPYRTPLGQVILVVLLACYAASLVWLKKAAQSPPPARFLGVVRR